MGFRWIVYRHISNVREQRDFLTQGSRGARAFRLLWVSWLGLACRDAYGGRGIFDFCRVSITLKETVKDARGKSSMLRFSALGEIARSRLWGECRESSALAVASASALFRVFEASGNFGLEA